MRLLKEMRRDPYHLTMNSFVAASQLASPPFHDWVTRDGDFRMLISDEDMLMGMRAIRVSDYLHERKDERGMNSHVMEKCAF